MANYKIKFEFLKVDFINSDLGSEDHVNYKSDLRNFNLDIIDIYNGDKKEPDLFTLNEFEYKNMLSTKKVSINGTVYMVDDSIVSFNNREKFTLIVVKKRNYYELPF